MNIKYTPVKGQLVSAWKTATSSSEIAGNEAASAFDGNSLSKWSAKATNAPQFLKVDLGKIYDISRCETFMDFSDEARQYKIEYSTDNVKWQVFADKSANTLAVNPAYVDENKAAGRWVRLTILPSGNKVAAGVYEFKVYSIK